ncbi:MAG TPA: ribosome maturation factor RimP [Terriglobales bacterium]|nr:ribosome maturation factor RimP [Terriglobales bacterium]
MSNIEEHVREIAERVAADLGLEVVDAELRGTGGKSRMLRVFIDKASAGLASGVAGDRAHAASQKPEQSGVTHEDCVAFSNEFGTILDAEDAIPGAGYTLEVSSPGLDRKLVKAADYERFAGQLAKVTTREPVDGRRNFQGRLKGIEGGQVALALEERKTKKVKGKPAPPEATAATQAVKIELANIEKANLVPEF